MPVKDHKSSFRLFPSVRLFISQFCHVNAESPGRCFIQHLSQLPFHIRNMGITTPILLIPVRTSAREGAQNTRALHLPFLEGLRQILPGLSPPAPRRPPLRPPRGRPFPHPTTEGLLSRKCSSIPAGGKTRFPQLFTRDKREETQDPSQPSELPSLRHTQYTSLGYKERGGAHSRLFGPKKSSLNSP